MVALRDVLTAKQLEGKADITDIPCLITEPEEHPSCCSLALCLSITLCRGGKSDNPTQRNRGSSLLPCPGFHL